MTHSRVPSPALVALLLLAWAAALLVALKLARRGRVR